MGTGAGTELFPSKLTHVYWRENFKSILRKIVKKEKMIDLSVQFFQEL